MKTFKLSVKNKNGVVLSFRTIKAKDLQSAKYQAESLEKNWLPLTKAQKEMSESGISVTIS